MTGDTVMPLSPDRATLPAIPGSDVDPFSDDFLRNPHPYHAMLRDAGPVVHLRTYDIYAMARFDEVVAALKDWESFCSARGAGLADFARDTPWRKPSLLIESDPPMHDRIRRIFGKVMSLAAVEAHRPLWQAKAEALVDALVARGSFDAVADLAEAFPLLVFPELVGLQDGASRHLLPYAALGFNALGPRNQLLEQAERDAAEAVA